MDVYNSLKVLCVEVLGPSAECMDSDPSSLMKGFSFLGEKHLLALKVPKEYDGEGLSREEAFSFLELLTSYSGALGFFQRQHQAAGRIIALGDNSELKSEYLPRMGSGEITSGVAYSHLRFLPRMNITGRRTSQGIEISGRVSWVSGYRLFENLVIGFFLPEENLEGFGWIPFIESASVKMSQPFNTVSLSSLQTVSIEFHNCLIPHEQVISLSSMGTLASSGRATARHFVSMSALGLALKRELELIEEVSIQKYCPSLFEKWQSVRSAYQNRTNDDEMDSLFAQMHHIVTHLLHLARFSWGTAALICPNSLPNSLERRYREYLLFSMICMNKELREKCLDLYQFPEITA